MFLIFYLTGVKSFLFLSRSMLCALCAMRYAPCPLPSVICPLRLQPQVPPIAGRSSSVALLLPSALCRMKLVLRLDVGRWSRILRVWNNCQESRFDPRRQGYQRNRPHVPKTDCCRAAVRPGFCYPRQAGTSHGVIRFRTHHLACHQIRGNSWLTSKH